jgi:hypothetical protein
MRRLAVLGIVVLIGLAAASAVFAAQKNIPIPFNSSQRSKVDPYWDPSVPMVITKEAAPGDTVWIRVKDDSSCSYQPADPSYGSRGEAAPGWAVWCFDGGATDTSSNTTRYGGGLPGAWTHYDAHVFGQANRWHISTFDEYDELGGPNEDSTMWAGQLGDTLTWVFPPGYDDGWDYSLILDLGTSSDFRTGDGMTIGGVHKYAVELAYDYCFMQMSASNTADTATWVEIARFNGISDPDSTTCNGLGSAYWGTTGAGGVGTGVSPYLCARYKVFQVNVPASAITALGLNGTERLRVRWRVVTDPAWSDQDGSGITTTPPIKQQANTDGAWRVDHLYAKGQNNGTFNSYWPPAGSTSRDPSVAAGNLDFETPGEDGLAQISTPLLPIAQAPIVTGQGWNGSSWVAGKATIVDFFHLTNVPHGNNYQNYGQTCDVSGHWVWSASKTATGGEGNITHNGWRYRLASPILDVQPTSPLFSGTILAGYTGGLGVYTTWDEYICILETASEDVTDTNIRRYEGSPVNRWFDPEGDGFVIIGGCQNWTTPSADDWSTNMTSLTDSVQFLFEFWDQCNFNAATVQGCFPATGFNPHRKATYLIDNISVGFFGLNATQWTADVQDLFIDTFAKDVPIHPATKDNSELHRGDVIEYEDLMTVTVSDNQGIAQNSVVLHYRISTDCGSTWSHECPATNSCPHPQGSKLKPTVEWFTKSMSFGTPLFVTNPPPSREYDGDYQAVIDSADVAAVAPGMLGAGGPAGFWKESTVIEYYITALDRSGTPVPDTLPNRNSIRRTFLHRQWGAERQDPWPFEVTVLPCLPASAYNAQGSKKVLLNNDFYLRNAYDSESDYVSNGTINIGRLQGTLSAETLPRMSQLYEEALRDLNVKFDRYDNNASQISRGSNLPFYTEPTDADGFGGIRDGSANHRYHTVIWATGDHRQYTVTDSSQLEVANYLASDQKEANVWLSGQNICEDDRIAGGAAAPFNSGIFWTDYVGATIVNATQCPDNGGLDSVNGVPGQNRVFYIEGVNNANFTALSLEGGYADCPDRDRPDEGLQINTGGPGTETVIFQFDNKLHNLDNTAGLLNVQPTGGAAVNKMITTMFDLGTVTTRSARACIMRAVLVEFGLTLPAGSKYSSSICANGTTDVRPTTGNQFVLDQNYPNPFNPLTKITYALPKDNMKVELKIFDVSGREVTTLVNRVQGQGRQEATWNGKNAQGHDVGSGVYFYRLNADDLSATRKMVLLK